MKIPAISRIPVFELIFNITKTSLLSTIQSCFSNRETRLTQPATQPIQKYLFTLTTLIQ